MVNIASELESDIAVGVDARLILARRQQFQHHVRHIVRQSIDEQCTQLIQTTVSGMAQPRETIATANTTRTVSAYFVFFLPSVATTLQQLKHKHQIIEEK